MLYSILPIPSTEKTIETSSHTVLIQKSLRQSPVWRHSRSFVHVSVSFLWNKESKHGFFLQVKKFFFFLFLQLKFNSLFFLLILYLTFHFSCKNFEIRTVRFLEINSLICHSLICRNEFSRLSWLFIAVIVIILKRTGIITTNLLIALVVLGNPPVLHAAAGTTPSGF